MIVPIRIIRSKATGTTVSAISFAKDCRGILTTWLRTAALTVACKKTPTGEKNITPMIGTERMSLKSF